MKSTFADDIGFAEDIKLTPREIEIIHFVGLGLTNQEIAKILFLSPQTIKSHIKNVLWKVNARNRTHMVSLAWEQELLTTHTVEAMRFRFQQSRHLLGKQQYKRPGGR
jgi:DNA-binding NarL/FixJ family response regulator